MLPILFKSNFFTLYSYPFVMGVSWMFAYRMTNFLLEEKSPYLKTIKEKKKFILLFIGLILFSFIGAKLAFLFFSSGELLDDHSSQLSFWLGGGFVFYGGMFGAAIWTFVFIPQNWHRFLVPAAAFSHGIGRVGCFLAGCCYGHDHFPIQLVESAGLFIIGYWCLKNLKKPNLVYFYLGVYSIFRFVLEFFRADEIRGYWAQTFSSSQIISIVIIVFVLLSVKLKPRLQ